MDVKVRIETKLYEESDPLIQKIEVETQGAANLDGEMYTLIETIHNALLGMGYQENTINKFIDKDGQIGIS